MILWAKRGRATTSGLTIKKIIEGILGVLRSCREVDFRKSGKRVKTVNKHKKKISGSGIRSRLIDELLAKK